MSAEPAAVDNAEERRLWPEAPPPRRCARCGAEMSNQFVMTSEQENTQSDTRRWVCPNCGHQEMRRELDEPATIREEVTHHMETVIPPPPPVADGQQQQAH